MDGKRRGSCLNPTILIPNGIQKVKALTSQCGDALELTYDGKFVGSMDFIYQRGKIEVVARISDW